MDPQLRRRMTAPADATSARAINDLLRAQENQSRLRRLMDAAPGLAELGADIVTPGPVGIGTGLHSLYEMGTGDFAGGSKRLGSELAIGLTTAGIGNKLKKIGKLKKLAEVMTEGGEAAAEVTAKATPEAIAGLANLTDAGATGRKLFYDPAELRNVPNVPQVPITARNVPKRGLAADVAEAVKSNRGAFEDKVKRGMEEGGLEWYNLEPLRRDYVSELGDAAGNREFLRLTQHLAATSPRSKVAQNIRRASAFSLLNRHGMEVPEEQALLNLLQPSLGHIAHKTHIPAARDIEQYGSMAATDELALARPKTTSFGENLRGNYEPVTVDAHNARSWGLSEDRIPAAYDALEKEQQDIAAKLGIRPAQVQSSAWIGGADETGVADARPFMDVFSDVLRESAKRQGIPVDVLYQRLLRGTGTLGVLGAAGLGTAAASRPNNGSPTTPPL
jgi:hypothetical protein